MAGRRLAAGRNDLRFSCPIIAERRERVIMKLIEIKNLIFEYFRRDSEGAVEEMVEALKDISIGVQQGEWIAILGQNGSGKSTLAKQINALLLPASGSVVVDGMDTSEEELRLQIRQCAGMVFQNPENQIVGNLVEEDTAFGPENLGLSVEELWNRVNDALSVTGLEEYHASQTSRLSGGQKQRLAIAGVLAMEPKCIVLDEATAMLDPEGRQQVQKIVRWLQKERGMTVIQITHHMEEALAADRVFVMKQGSVAASGTPDQIFGRKELLEECGLCLPQLYQYLYFLRGQGILSEREAGRIRNVEELSSVLCRRYLEKGGEIEKRVRGRGNAGNLSTAEEQRYRCLTEGIWLDHVSYIYDKGFAHERTALSDISLGIGRGEFVTVIGRTGSGKSTLTQLLNGLYQPSEGKLYFNGVDSSEPDFPVKLLRQKVGLVMQYPEHQLFADTVEADVCFGPEHSGLSKLEAQKRAYEAIAAVGLPDTIYDASPFQLSGGQKRRVAIAGVLAMQPEYMVLDEPAAGLDPRMAAELFGMLRRLCDRDGITIVTVSHSMEDAAEYADRILVMDRGVVRMDGAVWEVFGQPTELEKLGMSVPAGITLLKGLSQAGADVELSRCRQMEICEELARVLS